MYLRETLLGLLQLDDADRGQLTRNPYATPLNASGFDRQLLGTIKSADEQLAMADQLHPYVRWEFDLLAYGRNTAGKSEMRVNQKITPILATGASLTIERIRFAGPTPTSHTNVEFDVKRGDEPKEMIVTKAGAELAIDAPGAEEWASLIGKFTLNVNGLPHLARLWATRLDPSVADVIKSLTLDECVQRILAIVEADARLTVHREDCVSLWKEAVDCDEVRRLLAVAYTGEKGLVVPMMPPNGRASEITDVAKLRELNDRAVELMKKLAILLDQLMETRSQ